MGFGENTFFDHFVLQHVRDVSERSWQEERDALWETGIRRWVALLDQWHEGESPLLKSLHSKRTFTEKAQILVDVFTTRLLRRLSNVQTALTVFVVHFEL